MLQKVWHLVKNHQNLSISSKLATYQKAWNIKKSSVEHNALDVMAEAVTKMAEVFGSQKKTNQGLEKLSVPTWDGNRKTYATWKREFKYCMIKYNQDNDEQLQRLRKALPKNSFWSNQVKPSTSIEQAWKILDMECLSLARVYKTCKEALEFV